MKLAKLVAMCLVVLLTTSAWADVSSVGNNDDLKYSRWLPKKAYIAFNYNDQNQLTGYHVAFQADGGELFNHWKLKNSDDYEIPFPFVMEVTLIVLEDETINKTDDWGFGRLDGNNSGIPPAYIDSSAFDDLEDTDKYGIGILNPHQLQEDVIYDYWMRLENISGNNPSNIPIQLRFRLNIDLSEAKKFGYAKDTIEDDFRLGKGWKGIITQPFGYRKVDVDVNYTAQEIGDLFSFSIDERKGSDYLTHSDYFNLSGMEGQWCKERGGDAYQVNSIEECFGLDDNDDDSSINENPQIFTEGNHTHIIADDYRCSKETNHPILCWEPGGDGNCWDAHKWYQMTCDVEEVPVLRGDFDYTISLSRDFTCNQVYNSGTNTSIGGDLGGTSYGTGNGTGSGYHNDSGDPWAGYVHHVGLRYLKIGKKSSGHWKGSKVWALSQIPTKRDFRVKLKRKGGKWTNVCAEIWFSHNKHFTNDDKYLGKECKKLSKKKYRKKKKKSVYVKNISIPKMEAGKNYYFFTRVTYDGGVNVSDDSDEYVKVEIADVSSKFKVDEVFGETPFTVNFTNKSKAVFGYITSYHWNFGDGATSNEANPTHTYTQAGAFTVQLTTTANWGEQKTSSATVVANNPVPDPPVDTDGDGITDNNEPGDTDNDGLANWEESFLSDADNDGVNDQLDAENFNPANDSDNDGFTNEEEKIVGTNPLNNNSFPDIVEEDNSNLQDSCQETAETATNGGWGWNPVTEQGCLVNYYQDSGSDENDSEDYCHETADTPTNGGWGWNPVTQEGCLVVVDSNASNEDNCEPTADTDTNGGWGWNSITEQGCLVSGSFDETEDDTTINPDDSENYCHETSDTPTNGGWGWNPVTQEGCLVNP